MSAEKQLGEYGNGAGMATPSIAPAPTPVRLGKYPCAPLVIIPTWSRHRRIGAPHSTATVLAESTKLRVIVIIDAVRDEYAEPPREVGHSTRCSWLGQRRVTVQWETTFVPSWRQDRCKTLAPTLVARTTNGLIVCTGGLDPNNYDTQCSTSYVVLPGVEIETISIGFKCARKAVLVGTDTKSEQRRVVEKRIRYDPLGRVDPRTEYTKGSPRGLVEPEAEYHMRSRAWRALYRCKHVNPCGWLFNRGYPR